MCIELVIYSLDEKSIINCTNHDQTRLWVKAIDCLKDKAISD